MSWHVQRHPLWCLTMQSGYCLCTPADMHHWLWSVLIRSTLGTICLVVLPSMHHWLWSVLIRSSLGAMSGGVGDRGPPHSSVIYSCQRLGAIGWSFKQCVYTINVFNSSPACGFVYFDLFFHNVVFNLTDS